MTPERTARHILELPTGVLAWLKNGRPMTSRIGLAIIDNQLFSLISDLSPHTSAIRDNPQTSLLMGDQPDKGDPLNHPRLSLTTQANFVDKSMHRAAYIAARPKSKLYFDFEDFHIVRFEVEAAFLNGGFGKAHDLIWDEILAA